ncbi:YceI family protein [Pseudoalteromonas mariniglutinosa]|uniref:YceI family protein n=1 Tax=Pseudoalteromonas mariniglutinosa TaxID=206042 RepID=UPI00384C6843
MFKSMAVAVLSLSSLILAPVVKADWRINNELSKVSFVSVKKNSIAEVHYFQQLSGKLTESGVFTVNIDLNSIETMIPIRNERMTQFLFETAQFPAATLTADLAKTVPELTAGQHILNNVKVELDFHGNTKTLTIDVLAHVAQDGELTVSSLSPILINAADFAVTDGILKLQELAGLPSIATAVPVSFALTLNKDK